MAELLTGKPYNTVFKVKNTGNVMLTECSLRMLFYQTINPDTGQPNIIWTSDMYSTWDVSLTQFAVGSIVSIGAVGTYPAAGILFKVPAGLPDGTYFYEFEYKITSAEAGTQTGAFSPVSFTLKTPVMAITITDITIT